MALTESRVSFTIDPEAGKQMREDMKAEEAERVRVDSVAFTAAEIRTKLAHPDHLRNTDFRQSIRDRAKDILVEQWNGPGCQHARKSAGSFIVTHEKGRILPENYGEEVPSGPDYVKSLWAQQGRTRNIPAGYEVDVGFRLIKEAKKFETVLHLAQQVKGLLEAYNLEHQRITEGKPLEETPFYTTVDMGLSKEPNNSLALKAENLREVTFRTKIISDLEQKITLLKSLWDDHVQQMYEAILMVRNYDINPAFGHRLALNEPEQEVVAKAMELELQRLQIPN